MIEFGSLGDLAHHLMQHGVAELSNTQKGIEAAADLLQREAKAEFGEYQAGVGPFDAWPELAESTKADRVAKGYSENDPLLRDGTLRDSIQKEVEPWEATVGSTDPVMEWQEFGTSRIPPRPVLGIALYRNLDRIQELIGHAAVSGFVSGDPVHSSLGYDVPGGAE